MTVTLNVPLFMKPGQELREGEDVTPEELRALGKDIHARLEQAAAVVEKLTAAGWEAQMCLYDIILSNPYIHTAAEAEGKLMDLGIDPEHVYIDEWPDVEDEDFEEGSQ